MSDAAQQFSPLFLKANTDPDEQPGLILLIQSTDRAEKSARLVGNSLLNSYVREKKSGISLSGRPGARLMTSDSKTDSLCIHYDSLRCCSQWTPWKTSNTQSAKV